MQKAIWGEATAQGVIPLQKQLPIQMSQSDATALPLVLLSQKKFGADMIRFQSKGRVGLHTHEGDHILVVLEGTGILTYEKEKHELKPGVIYIVPGSVPHAIDALTQLTLLAIGNDHRPAASPSRLEIVE